MKRRLVGVIGSNTCLREVSEIAYQLGTKIAARGYCLVCGGKGGVMEACCRGVAEHRVDPRVIIVGIIPEATAEPANPYCDIVIPTGIGYARNQIIVLSADVVVAIEGGSGTLSEISFAWQYHKPIIAISSSGGWAKQLAGVQLDSRRPDSIIEAKSPQAAIEQIDALLSNLS